MNNPSTAPMRDLSAWDVVIADDEPDNVGVVQHVLEFCGAKVRAAASGTECLNLLKDRVPSFVLLDIQMPHMSGWETFDAIRKLPNLGVLPLIALTAHAMTGDREKALTMGSMGTFPSPSMP
jgi:CheY-like chemotaxis protein